MGEEVVAQGSEILAAIVVVILDDLRFMLGNVPLLFSGCLHGTLLCRKRLGFASGSLFMVWMHDGV